MVPGFFEGGGQIGFASEQYFLCRKDEFHVEVNTGNDEKEQTKYCSDQRDEVYSYKREIFDLTSAKEAGMSGSTWEFILLSSITVIPAARGVSSTRISSLTIKLPPGPMEAMVASEASIPLRKEVTKIGAKSTGKWLVSRKTPRIKFFISMYLTELRFYFS